MDKNRKKRNFRERRHKRVRKKVHGTADRPRLCVFRSLKNIYAQIIDDERGATLVAISSLALGEKGAHGGNVKTAEVVGKRLAELAKDKSIEQVVFDRGGYRYHGRIKMLADAARGGGLKF